MQTLLRLTALVALLPLGACVVFADSPAPARPAPVVVQPAPSTGTVVVQPQPQ